MKTRKPNLQRKRSIYAALHIKRKLMSTALSRELRLQLKRRSVGIRKGDHVQILKGKFKGTEGSISAVDLKKLRVHVDTATIKKRDGTQVQVPLSVSNLRITKLITTDKKRKQISMQPVKEKGVNA